MSINNSTNYRNFRFGKPPKCFSWKSIVCLIASLASPGTALAYEVETHELLTIFSINRSILGDATGKLFEDLGLDNANEKFPNSLNENKTVYGLIRFGSVFEDDTSDIYRPLNHFYDPQNQGRPLTLPVIGAAGYSSFDWILSESPVIQISDQDYSYADANKFLRNALTSSNQFERSQNWGKTFQTLGQIVHHVQDMAQPQHVRNDDHCDKIPCAAVLRYKPSAYEKYTRDNSSKVTAILASSSYPDINLNTFNSSKAFWGSSEFSDKKGLAEFTSLNFVSIDTNFRGGVRTGNTITNVQKHPKYAFPGTEDLVITTTSINDPDLLGPPGPTNPLVGDIQFVGTQISDDYISTLSSLNSRTSTFSIFDSDLKDYNIELERRFALNRFNFDAAHKFLLPRAVSYGAGIIDYFFRGRIEAELTNDNDSIELTNVSEANYSFRAGDAFEVYYDTDTGTRKPVSGLSNLVLGSDLNVNGTHTITGLSSALESITDMDSSNRIFIVFDGDIGSERGIASTTAEVVIWNATVVYYLNRHPDVFYIGVEFMSGVLQINAHPVDVSIKIEGLEHAFEADRILDPGLTTRLIGGQGTFNGRYRFVIINNMNYDPLLRQINGAYYMGHDTPNASLPEFGGLNAIIGATRASIKLRTPDP